MNCDKNNRELESLKAYYSHLEELLFSQNENFEFNFDESHNSAVTRLMLENTTSDMCMFCGSMSVFSEEFYRGIGEKNQELADFLKEEMKKTLKKFFISEGKMLRVVLEKKPEGDDFFDSFILEKSVWEKSIKEKNWRSVISRLFLLLNLCSIISVLPRMVKSRDLNRTKRSIQHCVP